MRNSEFVCWIRGYVELCPEAELTVRKLHVVRNHISLSEAVEGTLTAPIAALRESIGEALATGDQAAVSAVGEIIKQIAESGWENPKSTS